MENLTAVTPEPDYKKLWEAAAAEARWLRNELDIAEAKLEIVYLIFGGEP